MDLIFIHGRSQQGRDKAALQRIWEDSLARGFHAAGKTPVPGVNCHFPYYGDLLFEESRRLTELAQGALVDRSAAPSVSAEEQAFMKSVLVDAAHARGITDAQIQQEQNQVLAERAWFNSAPVLAALRLLDRLPNVSAFSIELVTRDVWHYLTERGLRLKVNALVDAKIPKDKPCVIVAHSLGTIIAYNLLMDRKQRSNVRAFITVGSPLGIAAVVDRLPSDSRPRTAPDGVPVWFNARDPDDAVALHPVEHMMFPGTPSVTNFEGVDNRSENQHGVEDYLKDAKVALAIHDALEAG